MYSVYTRYLFGIQEGTCLYQKQKGNNMPSATKKMDPANTLQPGSVRPRFTSKNSQAHLGVSALSTIGHRNTSFQPLPRPLGLPPYHYSLTDNFPGIATNLD